MLITLARKPLVGSVVQNVLNHGTGAINVDACRISTPPTDPNHRPGFTKITTKSNSLFGLNSQRRGALAPGRWPANVLVTPAAADTMDAQSGVQTSGVAIRHRGVAPAAGASLTGMGGKPIGTPDLGHYDKGGASRYFKKVGQTHADHPS